MKIFGLEIRQRRSIKTDEALEDSRRAINNPDAVAQHAAVEFGVGLLARAFMVAQSVPAHPALTPEYLAAAMRDVLLTGNHLAYIGVTRDGVMLDRAMDGWSVTGSPSPVTWRYRGSIAGPTRNIQREVNQRGVIHIRVNAPPGRPWEGVSPLTLAGVTAEVLRKTEQSLSNEYNSVIGKILTHPASPSLETTEQKQKVKAALDNLDGKMAMIQSGGGEAARWSTGASSGGSAAWNQVSLGPSPDAATITLRAQVAQDILSAIGIPAGLFSPREGAVSRESYRQLLTATISPYARLFEAEFAAKLETPVRLQFHRLAAADVAARARAFQSLVQAGLDKNEARVLAGLDD